MSSKLYSKSSSTSTATNIAASTPLLLLQKLDAYIAKAHTLLRSLPLEVAYYLSIRRLATSALDLDSSAASNEIVKNRKQSLTKR